MNEKVILVLVSGMRPDSLEKCGHSFVNKFIADSVPIMDAKTVTPSYTFPSIVSLFHSIPPQRNGIVKNEHVPNVRPVEGLIERINKENKKAAAFYNWDMLRNINLPNMLSHTCLISHDHYENTDRDLTEEAIEFLKERSPDFVFLYLGETDKIGCEHGYMSEEYLKSVNNAWSCIEKIYSEFVGDYSIIVTSDHGGHEKTNGTDIPEDVTIPIIINSPFRKNKKVDKVNIMDIPLTIARLMGIERVKAWEGTSII